MGVYSEIIKTCPYCGGRGAIQTSEGTPFVNIDNPDGLFNESVDDLVEILRIVSSEDFCCESCNRTFDISDKVDFGADYEKKAKLIRQITGG